VKKRKILHVHSDYPDGREGYLPTKAVENLVDATESYSHFVISINRTSNPFKYSISSFPRGLSVVYWSLPLPIIYRFSMWLLCIFLKIATRKTDYDLVHGHKLTTDGFVARNLASNRSKPYFVSVRGGTDLNNIGRLPDMSGQYAKTFNLASCVFWVSPWAKARVCSELACSAKKEINLPNPCQLTIKGEPRAKEINRLVMITSYAAYKRKGVIQVINAVSELCRSGIDVSLDIFGGGEETVKAIIQNEIMRLGLESRVVLKGKP